MNIIKKVKPDCIKAIDFHFKGDTFRTDAIEFSGKKISTIIFDNCNFECGMKICNIEFASEIIFANCEFLNEGGLSFIECKIGKLIILNTYSTGKNNEVNLPNFFKGSERASGFLYVSDSSFSKLLINQTNLDLYFVDFTVKECFEYREYDKDSHVYIYWPESVAKIIANRDFPRDKKTGDISFFFRNPNFFHSDITIYAHGINIFEFDVYQTKAQCIPENLVLNYGFIKIISKNINSIAFSNVDILNAQIWLENVPVKNFSALNSKLGTELNMSFHGDNDENRKVLTLDIKECEIVKSNFFGREFSTRLNFTGTKFKFPPTFYETLIPEGSIFPSRVFFEVDINDENLIEIINAFRYLRKSMEERRDRDAEGEFYYLEQSAKIALEKQQKRFSFFRWLYGKSTDFGINYKKPLIFLILSTLSFTVIYACILSPILDARLPIDFNLIGRSLHFSIKQVALPFWSIKDLTPLYDKNVQTSPILILSILQSFVSGVAITLSILAVRWRFKRG